MIQTGRTASTYAAAVPSDTVHQPFMAIYVGGAGNVTVKTLAGASATFNAVPVGTTLWVSGEFVMATGTTATLMTLMN